MIRSIQKLRKFGVFDDFRKTNDLQDFGSKNIIYGWNYSGKTTLSRLFASLSIGSPYRECPGAAFEVRTVAGNTITENTMSPPQVKVEVFNSDFVASNLSWSGDDFESILLLGDDSIEAQKEIDRLSRLVTKRRRQFATARTAAKGIEERISEAKTTAAKTIKTTLQLVEAFTATHLSTMLAKLPGDPTTALLTEEAFADDMRTALTSEREKPKAVSRLTPAAPRLAAAINDAGQLLSYLPAVSEIIEHLREYPSVARWVEEGLEIHDDRSTCEFCGGPLTEERLAHLRGHFSRDLSDHKRGLDALLARLRSSPIAIDWLTPAQFNSACQKQAEAISTRLKNLCMGYNDDLKRMESAVEAKIEVIFDEQPLPLLNPDISSALAIAFNQANELITNNNDAIGNFVQAKNDAVQRVKTHLAATFALDPAQSKNQRELERLTEHQELVKTTGGRLNQAIQVLHAKIDRAQKGREKLNERIAQLLGSDVIQIEVLPADGADRFVLKRNGNPARNLSDGERTAIAFAFFLTKLQEHKSLDDVIVYIDDPISSLDSNHVFQVYAIIESTFFRRVPQGKGSPKWETTCNQLFISTHNFEFFEMLKKLPIGNENTENGARYFMVKRLSPNTSTLVNLPLSLRQYTSEYHYLFSVIHSFVEHPTKDDIGQLLALPNALRRFVELYTYMRLPIANSTVESRMAELLGSEKAHRITKLLHHFSHLETVDRVASHTQLVADIEAVVVEVMALLEADAPHLDALMQAIPQRP